MKHIAHCTLNGGYTDQREIIVDTVQIEKNVFESMALTLAGDELRTYTADTEEKAFEDYARLINEFANPFQKAIFNANLKSGNKYTLIYFNDFGFPVADKIVFNRFEFTTYAQYTDVVKMECKRIRKHNNMQMYLYDKSLIILDGWHNLKDENIYTIKDKGNIITKMSKYGCFDSRYIDDLETLYKDYIIMIYKQYKTGTNGKTYA